MRILSLLAAASLAASLSGCDDAAAATGPIVPTGTLPAVDSSATLNGTWSSSGDGFLSGITITTSRSQSGQYLGSIAASAKDCGHGSSCQLTGTVIEEAHANGDVGFSVTFREAPIGATIIGTFYVDGVLRAKIFTRTNNVALAPDTLTFRH